jgi:hypothetical protein
MKKRICKVLRKRVSTVKKSQARIWSRCRARKARQVHPARAHLDEEEDMQGLEEEGLDGEEVAGEDLVAVPGEEGPPGGSSLAALRGRRHALPLQDGADRRSPDGVAELAQLAVDPGVAPARVLAGEPHDQGRDRGVGGRSPGAATPPERPFPAHQGAMPAQHRLRRDQQHAPCPVLAGRRRQMPQLRHQQHERELLPAREARPRLSPQCDTKLVPQDRDLEILRGRRLAARREQIEQQGHQVRHG